jgi:transposase InsO family protein
VTHDDALYRFRVRALALAEEMGNTRAACRAMGIHPSTFYKWRNQARRFGLEILRPRERRSPLMPNAITPLIEQRVLGFSLAHPGFGPDRIAAELRRPKWGGIAVSPNGVWRVLRRHGLSTRSRRLAFVAGHAAPPGPERPAAQPERHLDVKRPGELVQMDCFYVGRLHDTKGVVWQYTAIDVASAYVWAELHVSSKDAQAQHTSALARKVAADLRRFGWKFERVMTDNGNEFRSMKFRHIVAGLGAGHTFIRSGRPQTNGCVERVQGTILEECWKPLFARYLIPRYTGLRLDLDRYLRYYNDDRAHTGRWTRGRTPSQVIGKEKMWPRKY